MSTHLSTIGNVASFAVDGADILLQIRGKARVQISILADDLARVRIAPKSILSPNLSRAVVKTDWPSVPIELEDHPDHLVVATSTMQLVIRKQPFVLECLDPNGNLIVSDDPARRIRWSERKTEVFKVTQPGEKYVGLGWRPHGLIRNGTRFVMRNWPSYDPPETFHSGVPLWYGLRNSKAYAVFFDDTSWGTIDVGATSPDWISFRNLGGNLDYYLFAGPTMPGILDRFTELTGRPFMPPRWAIGYHQCRWSYTPQSQLLEIAAQFRRRKIPCDCLYLDIDYMPGGHALAFDPATFPDPAGMLRRLHKQGFRVIANISPLLIIDDPKYAEATQRGHLLKTAKGRIHIGHHFYWFQFGSGQTGDCAWLDFTRSATRRWWARQHKAFLNLGVDGIWNDLNEPDELGRKWPPDLKYNFDGRPVDHSRASTQYPLIQAEMSYDILRRHHPARRPYVVSRGGYAGIQRCAALWTGDNRSNWKNDFRRNIPMGLSMSICGNPHNGHDIGGFFGHPRHESPIDSELYTRWMQAGVFSPLCRQHHDGFGNNPPMPRPFTEPWRFGRRIEAICRQYIELRYRLMPYLYTLFHLAHTTGQPIQRPTFYDFPDDPATLTQDHDFMFGPFMLVSPVTRRKATAWKTYLPAGADWVNWWDNSIHAGGRTATTATPLDRLPIFVRAGAIIPTGPVSQYDGQNPMTALGIEVYPAAGPSSFTLYEDDGISWKYLEGKYCKTAFRVSSQGDVLTIQTGRPDGTYRPKPRTIHLRIHGRSSTPTSCRLDGTALPRLSGPASLDRAARGWCREAKADVLHIRFRDLEHPWMVVLR